MNRAIFKYPLDVTDEQTVNLPFGAKVVHVGMQNDKMYLWAEVDPKSKDDTPVTFRIFGTGHPMPEANIQHVGTVFDGPFVWHVYQSLV